MVRQLMKCKLNLTKCKETRIVIFTNASHSLTEVKLSGLLKKQKIAVNYKTIFQWIVHNSIYKIAD